MIVCLCGRRRVRSLFTMIAWSPISLTTLTPMGPLFSLRWRA